MRQSRVCSIFSITLLTFLGACDLRSAGDGAPVDAELTADEQALARQIADEGLKKSPLYREPIYVAAVELYRVKTPEDQPAPDRHALVTYDRHALVTYYRYQGDLAILSFVNIRKREVIQVDAVAHLPVPLSKEEFAVARELGLGDARVKATLGVDSGKVEVESLLVRTASERDPLFGRRIVRLQFRVGRNYLTRPIVLVDLTNKSVTIENPTTIESSARH
jgi:hypothetical protein